MNRHNLKITPNTPISELVYCKDSELYHHGTKGMKWGVRRYQNKDGSLTAKGRQHRKTAKTVALAKKGKQYTQKFDSKKSNCYHFS